MRHGIKILTIYAFSTENWGRPSEEVRGLMTILEQVIERELNELHEQGVCIRHVGRTEGISPRLLKKIQKAVELTQNNDAIILNVAFNYGGRMEILRAAQKILAAETPASALSEELFERYLYTAGLGDMDLAIRTGGDHRLSNFSLANGARSFLFHSDFLARF